MLLTNLYHTMLQLDCCFEESEAGHYLQRETRDYCCSKQFHYHLLAHSDYLDQNC